MKAQPGDERCPSFRLSGRRGCISPTTLLDHPHHPHTHEIIRGGLDRSPMYTGAIAGIGPRYCPSIEDKIHRFAAKQSHQIFLEPEGLTTNEFYPNGISTSLPFDVQIELVRSIRGLEQAHILRPGYAIEYDYYDPRNLRSSLETKSISGCSLRDRSTALPATRKRQRRESSRVSMRRSSSGTSMPGARGAMKAISVSWSTTSLPAVFRSRIACSPAARNTGLRCARTNADLRLTEAGRKLGVVDDVRWDAFNRKRDAIGRRAGAAQVHLGHSPIPACRGCRACARQADRARVLPHGSPEASRGGLRLAG